MGGSKQYIPFSQRLVKGAIGRQYVIKHYSYGIVKTKFPDMTPIVASDKQRRCRNSFKALNAAAKAIYGDAVKREIWRRRLGNPPHLYRAIMSACKKELTAADQQKVRIVNELIKKCFTVPAVAGNKKEANYFIPVLKAGNSNRTRNWHIYRNDAYIRTGVAWSCLKCRLARRPTRGSTYYEGSLF